MGNLLKRLFQSAFPAEPTIAPPGNTHAVLRQSATMLKPVIGAYRRRFTQEGPTPKGVFWADGHAVKQRFDILARVIDPAHNALGSSTVNDLGCGYGALYDYLSDHPALRGGTYHGYDICQTLLDSCITRIRDPRASFSHAMRATERADYAFVSGTYNMSLAADDEDWQAYVFASLQDIWNQTDVALAFNMLDHADDNQLAGLFYADPKVFADFCRTKLSENIEVITNYGLPDFTIFVRR
ncbi:MAG: hypothetical protein HN644_05405 [Rhodospirillales bacterium]|nr:hypothetical protein [Rhodospirillales bacterium]MBT4039878.1 hypothetical protein [Rhodospirillales bacterium]MBT4627257.1 hypothetical protein [Rhodospirillales bacterium]MBT5351220.1 hypothetical protein [Rhodospirillales bacterium]MBT5520057.1 hypothetical protein [Rhodospirillales bacterium]